MDGLILYRGRSTSSWQLTSGMTSLIPPWLTNDQPLRSMEDHQLVLALLVAGLVTISGVPKGCDLCNHTKNYRAPLAGKLMPNHIPDCHGRSFWCPHTELLQSHGYNTIMVVWTICPNTLIPYWWHWTLQCLEWLSCSETMSGSAQTPERGYEQLRNPIVLTSYIASANSEIKITVSTAYICDRCSRWSGSTRKLNNSYDSYMNNAKMTGWMAVNLEFALTTKSMPQHDPPLHAPTPGSTLSSVWYC